MASFDEIEQHAKNGRVDLALALYQAKACEAVFSTFHQPREVNDNVIDFFREIEDTGRRGA